jgi:cysteine synthase A
MLNHFLSRAVVVTGAAVVFATPSISHSAGTVNTAPPLTLNKRTSDVSNVSTGIGTPPHILNGPPPLASGIIDMIGNTPLVELRSLSKATGRRILAKCEFLAPGGSVKDRAALYLIRAAEADGRLLPGGTIIEATGGNTGIALAAIAAAKGYKCILTVPPTTSEEKVFLARSMGARVEVCANVPFGDPLHYYARAATLAAETAGGVWLDQFENPACAACHYETTGPEIIAQVGRGGGKIDGLCLAAGTGGTIGGIAPALRKANSNLRVFLIDPPGSSLASLVNSGELLVIPGTTINEGVGIGRLTRNFKTALDDGKIESAFIGDDQEVVDMAAFLLRREGLFVGPSAALNVCGVVKAARLLPAGSTLVTVLCDSGARYGSKLWKPDGSWLAERGLAVSNSVKEGGLPFVA